MEIYLTIPGKARIFFHQLLLERRVKIKHALAQAIILHDHRAYSRPEALRNYWEESMLPTLRQIERACRRYEVFDYIRSGQLQFDEVLCPWTGGFFHGLKLSGALRPDSSGHYRVYVPHYSTLIEDMERLPCCGHLGAKDHVHMRRLLRCAATHLPTTDAHGIDVLSGLIAGARLSIEGETWLHVPQACKPVLDAWTIPYTDRRRLHFSPFYGALCALNGSLPTAVATRLLTVNRPAMCPLLPMTIWELVFGGGTKRIPPRANLIPFLPSPATRERHKWTRRFLHRQAVEWKIASLSDEMKSLVRRVTRPVNSPMQDSIGATGSIDS